MITPVDQAVYLVRFADDVPPYDAPVPARYCAPLQRTIEFAERHGRPRPKATWQFFGTDNDSEEDEVEIVARLVVMHPLDEDAEQEWVDTGEPGPDPNGSWRASDLDL